MDMARVVGDLPCHDGGQDNGSFRPSRQMKARGATIRLSQGYPWPSQQHRWSNITSQLLILVAFQH